MQLMYSVPYWSVSYDDPINYHNPADSSRRKAAIESKLRELQGAFGGRDGFRIEHLADRIDRISSSMDHEITVRRLSTLTHLIHAVQSALLRIKEGSYGFCEQCKSQIQPKRLDAVPRPPVPQLSVRAEKPPHVSKSRRSSMQRKTRVYKGRVHSVFLQGVLCAPVLRASFGASSRLVAESRRKRY